MISNTQIVLQNRSGLVGETISLQPALPTFNSLASILPEPSVSKRSKASRISVFCSSVNSFLGAVHLINDKDVMKNEHYYTAEDFHYAALIWAPTRSFLRSEAGRFSVSLADGRRLEEKGASIVAVATLCCHECACTVPFCCDTHASLHAAVQCLLARFAALVKVRVQKE